MRQRFSIIFNKKNYNMSYFNPSYQDNFQRQYAFDHLKHDTLEYISNKKLYITSHR